MMPSVTRSPLHRRWACSYRRKSRAAPPTNVVIVPRSVIRNGNQVLVVDEDERLRFRTVSIARIYGDDAYIDGGLEKGERLCITVLQAVIDGMRVEVVVDEAAPVPGVAGS